MATLKVAEPPLHKTAEGDTEIEGVELTVTTTVAVELEQPEMLPVIVYVVVAVGLAVTVAPEVALRPADGAHEYVVAPVAVNEVELPLQIVTAPGAITPKLMTAVAELEHVPLEPITV